ncbi:hypothetical protein TSUD_382260 [Trifolium subterraneum]|uniref:Uncharacterized protein n=1 Tax=Trifolium subterraneum TaxID=3900 RepID=A0A2Z6N6U6_TRISU|nr:hypothetical protein TSUD_382260 [Trifolium subterraneum]
MFVEKWMKMNDLVMFLFFQKLMMEIKDSCDQDEDAAEYGKIGRYYAAESMLILDPDTGEYSDEMTPSYGNDMLLGCSGKG